MDLEPDSASKRTQRSNQGVIVSPHLLAELSIVERAVFFQSIGKALRRLVAILSVNHGQSTARNYDEYI